jgi:hypothetical protein
LTRPPAFKVAHPSIWPDRKLSPSAIKPDNSFSAYVRFVPVFLWRHLYPLPGSRHADDRNQAEPMKAILRSGFLALVIMALAVSADAGRLRMD